ncbi:MAG: hypothetical protein CME64_09935 [Halobacteriovoraceae bacterium]|nr:hypothetical protein [Halobacteriovoraceae bacterium]|tara:strand:+ start:78516 stop:78950 length:435 start_codon:yes stop_codon:yes gene_type:complete
MKKLITTALIVSALTSTVHARRSDAGAAFVASGANATMAGVSVAFGWNAVAVLSTATASFAGVMGAAIGTGVLRYQGLDSESIEVLSGQALLEEQPALSLFKEDVLANAEENEEKIFEATGEEVNLFSLTDEEFAAMALGTLAE